MLCVTLSKNINKNKINQDVKVCQHFPDIGDNKMECEKVEVAKSLLI